MAITQTIPKTNQLSPYPEYTDPDQIHYWTTSQNFDISMFNFQGEQNATIDAMNEMGTQMNLLKQQTNEDYSSFNSQMSVHVETAAQSATDSQNSANASEISYKNTVNVIEEADITGTAGYTMDVVDDMFSRQRNAAFVGLV